MGQIMCTYIETEYIIIVWCNKAVANTAVIPPHTNNMGLASTLMMFTRTNRHDLCHKSSKCVVGGLFWSLSLNPPSINLLCQVWTWGVQQHSSRRCKGGWWVSQCSKIRKICKMLHFLLQRLWSMFFCFFNRAASLKVPFFIVLFSIILDHCAADCVRLFLTRGKRGI